MSFNLKARPLSALVQWVLDEPITSDEWKAFIKAIREPMANAQGSTCVFVMRFWL